MTAAPGDASLLVLFGVYLTTLVLSLAVVCAVVVFLPTRYLVEKRRRLWAGQHPLVRTAAILGKNLLGAALVLAGLLLSLPGIPGQGLLTILIGVMLLDFPGRRRVVRYILSRPAMLREVNRVRAWFRRPPLVAPPTHKPL